MFEDIKPTVADLYNLQGLSRQHPLNDGCIADWIFNEGGGPVVYDLSVKQNNGSFAGTTVPTWSSSRFGHAVLFNGSSSYISLAGNNAAYSPGTGTYSLVAWFKTGAAINQTIYSNGTGTTHLVQLVVLSGGGIQGVFRDAEQDTVTPNGGSVIDNILHQAVLVKTSQTSADIYLDGQYVATGTNASLGTVDLSTSSHTIGRFFTAIQHFNGLIDSIKLYNRALSAGEIMTLYYDPFLPYRWASEQQPVFYSIPAAPSGNASAVYYRQLMGA